MLVPPPEVPVKMTFCPMSILAENAGEELIVGANAVLTVMVFEPEHIALFVVAESTLLKLYVVVELGCTCVVTPEANAVPPQLAPVNQLKVYVGVPPVTPAVRVEYCPLSITVFVSSNVLVT